MSYLSPPHFEIRIRGTHTESHYSHSSKRHETRTVTDFSFPLDASSFIEAVFYRIAAIPKPGKRQQTIKEVFQEHCASKNQLKEIHLQKQVLWNLNELRDAISWTVRSAGYRHSIHVDFQLSNDEVYAYSSSALSRFSRNECIQCLCVLTCLCIIFAPIYFLCRKTEQNKYLCIIINVIELFVITQWLFPSDNSMKWITGISFNRFKIDAIFEVTNKV